VSILKTTLMSKEFLCHFDPWSEGAYRNRCFLEAVTVRIGQTRKFPFNNVATPCAQRIRSGLLQEDQTIAEIKKKLWVYKADENPAKREGVVICLPPKYLRKNRGCRSEDGRDTCWEAGSEFVRLLLRKISEWL
jgi:hypothetical protein